MSFEVKDLGGLRYFLGLEVEKCSWWSHAVSKKVYWWIWFSLVSTASILSVLKCLRQQNADVEEKEGILNLKMQKDMNRWITKGKKTFESS